MSIVIENLSKSYSDLTPIHHLSAVFDAKNIYAIKGPSGCGKSTLLRLIAGLEKPDAGKIEVKGEVAFAFQEHRLFPWLSAEDNIALTLGQTGKIDEEERKKAREGLLRYGFSLEETKKKPSELSGGMKQRIALLRVLLAKANNLFFDEPTKELDTQLRHLFCQDARALSREKTILMVTHQEEDIKQTGATLFTPWG